MGLLLFLLRGFPEPVSRKVTVPAFGIVLTTNHMAVFQITTKQLGDGTRVNPVISYLCPTMQVIEIRMGRVLLNSPDNGEMGNGGFLDE